MFDFKRIIIFWIAPTYDEATDKFDFALKVTLIIGVFTANCELSPLRNITKFKIIEKIIVQYAC